MANYWAITIGINQYRHFQPLMYAQDDALLIHRFFAHEAGIPEDQCILLSDLTTSVADRAVYPDKPAIAQWMQTITQQIAEGDTVWFFFSGYGAQVDGKDYLMPIDGDSNSIESTGIAAADLIDTLAQLPTEKVFVLLDFNRSQSALAGQAIGTETLALAEKRAVTTFLSCQPEQYSHETIGVRHGLFTAALIESLHQNCKTPKQISEYLNKRLPELCDHHWRPVQNPVAVIAADQMDSEIVPQLQSTLTGTLSATDSATYAEEDTSERASRYGNPSNADKLAVSAATGTSAAAGTSATTLTIEPPVTETSITNSPVSNKNTSSKKDAVATDSRSDATRSPYTEETLSTGSYRTSASVEPDDAESMAVTGAKLRNWGLLALALLMGGVLLKQPFVQTAWQNFEERINQSGAKSVSQEGSEETNSLDAATASDSQEPPAAALPEAEPAAEGAPEAATETTPEPNSASTDEIATQLEDTATSANDTATNATEPAPAAEPMSEAEVAAEQATAKALIAQANASIEQRQYSEALITLQQVPRTQRDSSFSAVLTKARTGSAEAQQTNASVLTEARTSIQPTQASQFTEAIAKARLIQPGEPYYETAQRDIRSWSQVILDIAEGRATSGNIDGAIAAASVMPQDNTEFYQKAQDRIAFWQQRQNSRKTIAAAQTIPKLGQASTYQQGIVKLREVPIEHPEYETAQRLADQWSQSIFSIAQARAAQGRENAAIQAAILVPAGTTAYEPTQQAIRRWKTEE